LILSNQIKLFSLKPNLSIFDLEKMFAPVAQWIEQKFPKLLVGGSIPLGGTENIEIKKRTHISPFLLSAKFQLCLLLAED
jgi:hypothetical protein